MLGNKWLRLSTALLLIAGLFALNIFSSFVNARLDFTEGKIYTLSQATQQIINDLPEPLVVKVFASENVPPQAVGIRQSLVDRLNEYAAIAGGQLKIEYLDPAKGGEAARLAQALEIPPLTLQVVEKDKKQVVRVYFGLAVMREKELAEPNPQNILAGYERYATLPLVENLGTFEYELTTLIRKIGATEEQEIGFLRGHGEHRFAPREQQSAEPDPRADYAFREQLEKNYRVSEYAINPEEPIGVDTLVIAGPQKNFEELEIEKIKEFVASGKNVVFLLDRVQTEGAVLATPLEEDFSELLDEWGLAVEPKLVADAAHAQVPFRQESGFFVTTFSLPYPLYPLVTNLNKSHPITAQLETIVLPWASPLKISEREGVTVEALAESSANYRLMEEQIIQPEPVPEEEGQSSAEAEVEVNPADIQVVPIMLDPQQDFKISSEKQTPVPLAVIAQRGDEGKLVVVGDADFIAAAHTRQYAGNLQFFFNMLDSLTLGNELIEIRSKAITDRPLRALTELEKNLIKWGNIIGVSLIVVVFGLVRRSLRQARKRIV
ncbi:MAG: GldG family protein [Patescibacteria group bacterium]